MTDYLFVGQFNKVITKPCQIEKRPSFTIEEVQNEDETFSVVEGSQKWEPFVINFTPDEDLYEMCSYFYNLGQEGIGKISAQPGHAEILVMEDDRKIEGWYFEEMWPRTVTFDDDQLQITWRFKTLKLIDN